jgi:hypothetical protein
MEAMVKADREGMTETYVGMTICEGPCTCRLVLTRPYHRAGRIVEIPRSSIESIEVVEPRPLGEQPKPN